MASWLLTFAMGWLAGVFSVVAAIILGGLLTERQHKDMVRKEGGE